MADENKSAPSKKQMMMEIISEYRNLPPDKQQEFMPEIAAYLNDPYDIDTVTETVDDKPADIQGLDRANIKNFGNSTYDAITYLENKHPGYEFGHKGGEIFARKTGEAAWKPLDPSPSYYVSPEQWEGSGPIGELAKDVTDVGYDTAMAIPKGIATAAAGLYGGITTGGVGALPAAAATAGSLGTLQDLLRQYVGKKTGVNSRVDSGQAFMTGAMDAALAPTLGTGVSTVSRNFVGKNTIAELRQFLAKRMGVSVRDLVNMSDGEVLNQVGKTFRYGGLTPKMMAMSGTATKGLTSILTGRSTKSIQDVADNPNILLNEPGQMVNLAQDVQRNMRSAVTEQGKRAQSALDQAVPNGIYVGQVRNFLRELEEQWTAAAKDPKRSPQVRQQAKKVLEAVSDLRTDLKGAAPDKILSPEEYQRFNLRLGRMADFPSQPLPDPMKNAARQDISVVASDTKKLLNEVAADQAPNLEPARQVYAQAKQDAANVNGVIGAPGKTTNLRGMIGSDDQTGKILELRDMANRNMTDPEYGQFLRDTDQLHANMQFNKEAPIDLPVGTMKSFGAMGAVGLKGSPSRAVAKAGAGILRAGQAGAKLLRTGAPMAGWAFDVNRDPVLESLGLGDYGKAYNTLSPEEQAKQDSIMEILVKMGEPAQ